MKVLFFAPETGDADAWRASLARVLPGADIRVWRPPRELFTAREGLKAVFNLGAGVDAILRFEREAPGTLSPDVPLIRLEDTGMAAQMNEYAAYAVLRYLRRFDEYELMQRSGEPHWQVLDPHPRETFVVAVLGLGVLGTQVARTLASFGLPVRGYSRSTKTLDGIETFASDAALGGTPPGTAALDACLEGARVVVNLLPSTPETEGVLNRRAFARLARGAYLVNLARGAHVVEEDLLDALHEGRIAAATLDVFREEPLPAGHRFWREPRVTITPHVSAQTLREPAAQQIAAKIAALSRGEAVSGIVDVARGY